ncbi:hypothetical protein SAMN04487947_0444 [Halogeometricum rufum]|uniref:Uncharacterized protein n=2 Tax=Halogeometricum rufum TaxID=553469 RepID=A0A1I6G284_9EURY|nr:hypothetical protein SAMN04487947_0444 [Halogeometricum rufum]
MSVETIQDDRMSDREEGESRSVVQMGQRQSVCIQQLIREMVGDLETQALRSETRNVVDYGGALYINPTAWGLDWHELEAGSEVVVRTFPDAILITREDEDV